MNEIVAGDTAIYDGTDKALRLFGSIKTIVTRVIGDSAFISMVGDDEPVKLSTLTKIKGGN